VGRSSGCGATDSGRRGALLIFFAFAMQCMSTIAVVRRENGGWKWPALQFAYMTFLAISERSSPTKLWAPPVYLA